MKPRVIVPVLLCVALAVVLGLPRLATRQAPAAQSTPSLNADHRASAPALAALPATPAPATPSAPVPAPSITAASSPALDPALFFGVDGPVSLADIPDSPFRTSLVALSVADRATALARLTRLNTPRSQLDTLRASAGGALYHVCSPGPHAHHAAHAARSSSLPAASAPTSSASISSASVPITQVPAYSSKPGSTNVLYLDFNGHTVSGTLWNRGAGSRSRYDALPYDSDGNTATFSDAEQAVIRSVWERVSEDYRAFDINVTTVEPAEPFTSTTGRVVITQALDANGYFVPGGEDSGGVAYLGVFGEDDYTTTFSPAWAIADNVGDTDAANIAEVVSHEFGHNLGLDHDGTTSEEYYLGHGSGATSWAPIMGAGYGRNVTAFSKGEYFNANNPQDDLDIIDKKLSYRADAVPDTLAGALALGGIGASTTGVIERSTDADRYRFSTASGAVRLDLSAFSTSAGTGTRGNNLHLLAELLDSSGAVVGTYSSSSSPDLSIDTSLAPGTYYLRVQATGAGSPLASPPTGYTSYGSIGTYTITNNTSSVPPPAILESPVGAARPLGSSYTFSIVSDSTTTSYRWRLNGVAIPGATSSTYTIPSLTFSSAGNYTCVVANSSASATSRPAALAVYRETPQTYTINPGTNATFPTLVAGTFDSFTWLRDGQAIVPLADPRVLVSGSNLRINNTLNSDAATYTLSAVFAGQTVPVGPVTLVVRPPVVLSVPATVSFYRGDTPTVPITSSHSGLTYAYSGLPAGVGYTPSTGALYTGTASITPGTYAVTLTGTDSFQNRGKVSFDLVVLARTLDITVPATVAAYTGTDPVVTPTIDGTIATYSYSGLPAGLNYNASTGVITARVPAPPPGSHTVTLTVTDAAGNTGTTTFTLQITSLDATRLVPVSGLVARDSTLNQNLGGSLTATPVLQKGVPTGAYTGALTLGADRYTLTGRLARGAAGQPLTLALTALAKNKLSLALTVTLPADGSTGAGFLQPNSTRPVALSAWPTPYTKLRPATAFAGRALIALLPVDPPAQPAAPAGNGFGALAVSALGKATFKLRLPDGTAVTHSTTLTEDGHLPVHAILGKNVGSLLGAPGLGPTTRNLDGTLSWLRLPASPSAYAKTVLYRDGYGPLDLTVTGRPPQPPAKGTRILGRTDSDPAVRLAALDAGLSTDQSEAIAAPALILTAKNTILPILAINNPAAVTLSINAADGTFNGTFTLKNPDPLKSGTNITRKVAFQGVLLETSGVGYFLVPGLKTPDDAYPPTLSGAILLEPTP